MLGKIIDEVKNEDHRMQELIAQLVRQQKEGDWWDFKEKHYLYPLENTAFVIDKNIESIAPKEKPLVI